MARGQNAEPIALSVDVEDWFHTENVKRVVPRETWDSCESRVAPNTGRILDILAQTGGKATFFVLGWVAERHPGLVRDIVAAGHELASHGYAHELVYTLRPSEFRNDVLRARKLLEDISGCAVRGYRAPCFSITDWAVTVLQEAGYAYDSSVVPTLAHDRYGRLDDVDIRRPIRRLRQGFHEVSVSCLKVGRRGVPWGGGGYFRLVPFPLWLTGVAAIRRAGRPYVFYIHPWELDPGQPEVAGLGRISRFRQRVNLPRCERRFAALARRFPSTTVSDVLERWIAAA